MNSDLRPFAIRAGVVSIDFKAVPGVCEVANAIGLRVYQIYARPRGGGDRLPIDDIGGVDLIDLADRYLSEASGTPSNNDEKQRSYQVFLQRHNEPRTRHGILQYGIYGFESAIRDNRTGLVNYNRQITDQEQIPLYFQIWLPAGIDYGLICFQSFQGRSCVGMVLDDLKRTVRGGIQGAVVHTDKLMPTRTMQAYQNAPVKEVRLISRQGVGDRASRYAEAGRNQNADRIGQMQLTISAPYGGVLGNFGALKSQYDTDKDELMAVDGTVYEEAIAEIELNGKSRVVTMIGAEKSLGVIDVTKDVQFGTSGHPEFNSLASVAGDVLSDFVAAASS